MTYFNRLPEIGSGIPGIATTATLYVSPEGSNTDGKTWATAYTTIQAALTAASTDADECTAIIIGPHATNYDINTTGDPTWTGNYHLMGSHRLWAPVKNTHASATSVMKFTGQAAIQNLAIFTQGTVDGVIFTADGWRVRECGFNSSGTSGATTSVYIDGSAAITKGGIMEDVQFVGNATYTKAIHINQSTINEFRHVHIHDCLTGVHIVDADSDQNLFEDVDIGDCDNVSGIGIDIDAGNEQHFKNISFHHNTKNVDDEVGDHVWEGVHGQFPIAIIPGDLDGAAMTTGAAAAGIEADWGNAYTFVAADAEEGPYRIVGVHVEPADSDWYELRFSADSGSTYYDRILFTGGKREGQAAPSGTEFIFNAKSELYAEARNESGTDGVNVWIEIQRI